MKMYRFHGKHATKKSSIQSDLQKIHSQSHFSSNRNTRLARPRPVAARHRRAHPSCGLAVGRDVPIAPPRLGAVRGFASRAPLLRAPPVRHRRAPSLVRLGGRARCPHRAAAPQRGARLGIPHPVAARPRCSPPASTPRGMVPRLAAGGDDQTPRPARL